MIFISVFNNMHNITDATIIMLLVIVINNQIRFFNFLNYEICLFISMAIELVLISMLSIDTHVFNYLFLLPLMIDTSFFIDKYYKYALFSVFTLVGIYLSLNLNQPITYVIEAILTYLILILLCIYINKESIQKSKYLKTNEELKISKDALIKNNENLEDYASSVEHLAVLKERNRISREIHDSVGHAMSTTIIQLGAIETLLKDNPEVTDLVSDLKDFVKSNFQDVRQAVNNLKPNEYENYQSLFKIKEVVENFNKITDCTVKLTVSKNTWSLNDTQLQALYRVVQESLSNSYRHGKSTEINIFLLFNKNDLITTIADNGKGCKTIKKGNGINGISERIYELNGSVNFESSSKGFVVRATIPRSGGGFFE